MLRRGLQAQRPHQHFRHFAPGDRRVGAEGFAAVHHIVLHGGPDGGAVSGGKALRQSHGLGDAGFAAAPAHHPAQHRDELGPGHGVAVSEGGLAVPLHETVVNRLADLPGQCPLRRNIPVVRGSRRDRQK